MDNLEKNLAFLFVGSKKRAAVKILLDWFIGVFKSIL
jgi:hypothetical protein